MHEHDAEGLIVAHYGIAVGVRTETGETVKVRVRRRSGHVVGDRVSVRDGDLKRHPRNSELRRLDNRGEIRLVASNLDVLGIVIAPVPLSPETFIDRAIVTARATGMQPFLVLNKADLAGSAELEAELRGRYGDLLTFFLVSAVDSSGMTPLVAFFAEGHRGAFVGTTGVGKSSIMNILCPDIDLAVGEINETTGLGRHTTTVATLHSLPGGGELIDTPGFRDFGLAEIDPAELGAWFPGFEAVVEEGCRFRNCLHRAEPGCALTAAVQSGTIPVSRRESYIRILDELEEHQARLPRRKD
ncbi:MAG: ribosome small subunit-dependent GTPase A [Acidobacteria bacterium]|uniref:Small ribosomal subunit biogenesis GTPase RsgA n=1 Tax=Candidatus Polarisedimenticola svalbardensis TaxID=2886004 RepID=A0A8J6Y9A8_9BACT|nr:ribosome small subunit-dependent GTPase A [Candidatus Polarisedimenticola svalbardensis]